MKQNKIYFRTLLLCLFLGLSDFCSAKTEIDTITNWQLYKDSKLLLKSNEFDSHRFTAKIKTSEKYDSLYLNVFYDFLSDTIDRKVEFIRDGKVLSSFQDKNPSHSKFKISKKEIDRIIKGNLDKEISIKYFDKINPNGFIIGILIFVEK